MSTCIARESLIVQNHTAVRRKIDKSIDLMVDWLLGLILTYNLYFKFNTYGLIQFLIRVFL